MGRESSDISPVGRERRGDPSVTSVLGEVPIERKLKIDVKNANRSIAHLLQRERERKGETKTSDEMTDWYRRTPYPLTEISPQLVALGLRKPNASH